ARGDVEITRQQQFLALFALGVARQGIEEIQFIVVVPLGDFAAVGDIQRPDFDIANHRAQSTSLAGLLFVLVIVVAGLFGKTRDDFALCLAADDRYPVPLV